MTASPRTLLRKTRIFASSDGPAASVRSRAAPPGHFPSQRLYAALSSGAHPLRRESDCTRPLETPAARVAAATKPGL